MSRRLLGWTVAALLGYAFHFFDRAFGHWPPLLLTLTAGLGWLAGVTHLPLPLTQARTERDLIAARLAELEGGGTYLPAAVLPHDPVLRAAMLTHPSVRGKRLRAVQNGNQQ